MISRAAWARIAGWALLAIIVLGFVGMGPRSVDGTAALLSTHALRYRAGLACEFLMLNNDILLAVALYALLKPVDPALALLGALWRFANAAMLGVGIIAALTGLQMLASDTQVQSESFIHLHGIASLIGLWFWSMGAALHSWLLWRARYIPRVLSGSYLVVAVIIFFGCLSEVLSPALGTAIDPWFVLPDLPVELAVALWLIIRGASIPVRAEPAPA